MSGYEHLAFADSLQTGNSPLTPRYAVVGDPIAHSKSPQIHRLFAAQTGETLVYDKHRVSSARFPAFVTSFFAAGGGGLNVTLPHKQAAFALAGESSHRSRLARAANTLWLNRSGVLCAENTDGSGLVRDLAVNHGVQLEGRRVLVLGAGGATRGLLAALVACDPGSITVLNRTLARAQLLQADFAAEYALTVGGYGCPELPPQHVIINATAMSLADELPPIDPAVIGEACCCYDLMYGNQPTAFMAWAETHGADKALDGLGMLVEQAADSFLLWRGIRPDTAPVIAALRT